MSLLHASDCILVCSIYAFNTHTLGVPVARYHDPAAFQCRDYYMRTAVSPDGRYLLTGSDSIVPSGTDASSPNVSGKGNTHGPLIWELDAPERPPIKLWGRHQNVVKGVAW